MKILIDTGHCLSGADTGAQGCGYREENLTRQIGFELRDVLEGLGHNVVICSCDSANSLGESLAYRVNKANREGGDLYVSIHLNAFNGEAYGAEVYTYGGNRFIEAERVLNSIVDLGYTNRGIKDGSGLYVIRNTNMKAMLIECCFIDNIDDMGHFNYSNIANAIAGGIVNKSSSANTGDLSKPNSKPSSSGDIWIRALQEECNRQGFSNQSVDGYPGPNTLAGCPTIRVGAQGEITRILQQILINRGYSCGNAGTDGMFGEGTYRAVTAFQNGNRLDADGIVGQNTWRALLGL